MATGLPNISARGGTQDQPLRPPPLGRPKRSVPRTQTHPDRHPGPSQRHQPRPPGHPGPAHRNRGLGHRLTPPSTPTQGSIFRCRRGQNSNVADTNPTKRHYISAVLATRSGPSSQAPPASSTPASTTPAGPDRHRATPTPRPHTPTDFLNPPNVMFHGHATLAQPAIGIDDLGQLQGDLELGPPERRRCGRDPGEGIPGRTPPEGPHGVDDKGGNLEA